ncbi:GH1 family beta-glucosidase [Porcipelethomonas sp.]|uniref:GH1 family beta-glucosidase n=1 Tax=Porcipelethomonas sp. TaxID=2981675 RepID=UPI003EF1B1CD
MDFGKNFIWGAATSSYQVEGGAYEDGKGLNIFDTFCQIPGRIDNNDNGDTACDHYHRWKDDIALMKEIGLKAYRFSLNWARILPEGTGKVNPKGIEFYNNIIDELLKNNIEPFVTLYHWDLPLELDKRGGWRNPDIVKWFYEYAKVAAENFSDRVTHFMTINEPQVILGLGYQSGRIAPGLKLTTSELLEASHNLLKAHGAGVAALRIYGKQPLKIGYAPCGNMNIPASEKPEDIEAARKSMFSFDSPDMAPGSLVWFNDPVFFGKYPEHEYEICEKFMPEITDSDMKLISQPLDFIGHNVYWGHTVAAAGDSPKIVSDPGGFRHAPCNWPVTPDCLYWGTKFLYERYKKPIFITENGKSCYDTVSPDGHIHDTERIDYINGYLKGLKKSINEGTDVAGYFHWSLMDNFEWAYGYTERFGLIHVDYKTLKRTLKDSAYRYSEIIKTNGSDL